MVPPAAVARPDSPRKSAASYIHNLEILSRRRTRPMILCHVLFISVATSAWATSLWSPSPCACAAGTQRPDFET
jgi:hypothetical protein